MNLPPFLKIDQNLHFHEKLKILIEMQNGVILKPQIRDILKILKLPSFFVKVTEIQFSAGKFEIKFKMTKYLDSTEKSLNFRFWIKKKRQQNLNLFMQNRCDGVRPEPCG